MTESEEKQSLTLYQTPEHDCSYLPDKNATTVFADPKFQLDTATYQQLLDIGFRRSGNHVYRPQCAQCQACIALRLPVKEFLMNRNQKRNWKLNSDLNVTKMPAGFNQEHFDLYQRYQKSRHPEGDMGNQDTEEYTNFLMTNWLNTDFYEFRKSGKLLAVAVVDQLINSLSAVYTFYDPQSAKRSLGRYAVLYEIEEARKQDLKWLYLGYWIAECKKMAYKNEYQPIEYFSQGKWQKTAPNQAV